MYKTSSINMYYLITLLIPRIRNWSYNDRLRLLGLSSLLERRITGDLIQLFKIGNSFNIVSWVRPLLTCTSLAQPRPAEGIRGHKDRLSLQSKTKCFLKEWNSLPDNVINASTVNQFKNRYDKWKEESGWNELMYSKASWRSPTRRYFHNRLWW